MEAPVFEEAWKTNLPGFLDPAITKASFDNAMRFQKAIGQEMTLTYEQAIAPTFVDDAKRELGFR